MLEVVRSSFLLVGILGLSVGGCGSSHDTPAAGAASGAGSRASGSASGAVTAGDSPGGGVHTGEGPANTAGGGAIPGHELPPPSKPIAGFKPSTSGFKFQNYGNEEGVTNLTIAEVRRMFGDQVCASLKDDQCVLTPAAEQWVEGSNRSMAGGHCEGFAALALLMQRGQVDPKAFGADTPADLELSGNVKLQREIAYWFVTQGVMPMAEAEDKTLTPKDVVAKLRGSFQGGTETYTLGIYAPGYQMGHATTPYDVVDKEGSVVWIMHYDNNYPGEEKHVEVDLERNTWSYTTAADPAASEHAYVGDAETKTLTIAPTSVRTGPLVCHFCGAIDAPPDATAKGSAGGKVAMREIELDGDADLLITDEAGHRMGYVGDKLVQEIPGAFFASAKSADHATEDEPSYFVPEGTKLRVTLDGADLEKDSLSVVSLFGRGYTLAVEGVALSPGQQDHIDFSADWSTVTYATQSDETPTLVIGIETTGADYELEVQVAGEAAGQTVELSIDPKKETFAVRVKGAAASKPILGVHLTRIDDAGEHVFRHKGVTVGAEQLVSLAYGAWKGDKTPLHVTVTGADGAVVSDTDENDED